ncbi:hypothetical protein HJC23_004763 [Cyclotella cryptica]|uniref:Uncharacterized protein n=1 Tax=Cyclotella cryptica TaxID=29204 RepID=A0ABD3PBS0_9STRA
MPPKKATSRPSTPAAQLPETAADTRKIPADLLKNLRGAALLAALAEVYSSKVTNTDGKHIEMENNFFGAEERDTASLLHSMLRGEGAFSALFEQVQTPAGHDLYLREHLTGGHGVWIAGKHFDQTVLSRSAFKQKTSARATGRALYDNASDITLCNCKKAMSLISKLVPKVITLGEDNSVVGYASGETEEDFLRYINDGMYSVLNEDGIALDRSPATKSTDDDELTTSFEDGEENLGSSELLCVLNGDNDDEEDIEDIELTETVDAGEAAHTDKQFKPFGVVAPANYRFPGYFAFACFGPTRGVYFLDLLNPSGNSVEQLKVGKKTSRVAHREKEAKKLKCEREYSTSRGIRMETKVQLASIAQSEESASMRQKESRIAVIVSIIASKEKARDCKMQLLAHAEDKQKLFFDIDSLNDTIDILNDELKQLSEEKRETSKIVQAVMREAEQSMGVDENN